MTPILFRRAAITATLAALAGVVPAASTAADAWPAKPIRLFVPFPAGGGTDIIAREVSGKIAALTKWNFVVDNRPGSGGNIGVDATAKAAPDGYTLVIGQTSNLAINPTLYAKLPYDPVNDLAPIGLIGNASLVIVVAANASHRNVNDVLAAARARPGVMNYATSGNGTVAHLATELLQREAGVTMTHIPYKGASQGINDVMGGQVQLYVSSVPTLIGYVKSGKMRALAVTGAKRTDDLPGVPTIAEALNKSFDAVTWFGFLAPAKTPAAVIATVNTELNRALAAADLKKKLEDQGLDITPGTPDQFGRLVRSEIVKWGRVVKESGAKAE